MSNSDNIDNQEARWQGCTVPPKGWWCSRKEGHPGPCAARAGEPSQDDAERHARAIYSVSLAGEGLALAKADDVEMLIGRDRAALRAVKAALVYPSRPCICGECLECDAYGYNQDQIAEADNQEALAGEGVEATKLKWRCFHCGDVFTSEQDARLHFGDDDGAAPACVINGADGGLLKALREAETAAQDAWNALHDETTDVHKAMYAASSRHSQALISAEESGYEKGLADARTLPSNEALAGDDRNREIEILRRALVWHGEPSRMATTREDWQQTIDAAIVWVQQHPEPGRPSRPMLATELVGTPSSPQADEADVERVGEWRCIECKATFACAVEPVRCPIGDCKGRTFANFGTSTMTTRPAGVEEVEDALVAAGAKQMRAVLDDGHDDETAFYSALEAVGLIDALTPQQATEEGV